MGRSDIMGKPVMKQFEDGWYKGYVSEYGVHSWLIVYEDGDTEHMRTRRVKRILYTPVDDVMLCSRIQYISDSGCKSQSFAKMCREIVNERPFLARMLSKIYLDEMGVNINADEDDDFKPKHIGPFLWKYLGESEMEKLYYANCVMEKLMAYV